MLASSITPSHTVGLDSLCQFHYPNSIGFYEQLEFVPDIDGRWARVVASQILERIVDARAGGRQSLYAVESRDQLAAQLDLGPLQLALVLRGHRYWGPCNQVSQRE